MKQRRRKPGKPGYWTARSKKLGRRERVFDEDEAFIFLKAAIEREGSLIAFSENYGVDKTYVSHALHGRFPIAGAIIKALGFRKVYIATKKNRLHTYPAQRCPSRQSRRPFPRQTRAAGGGRLGASNFLFRSRCKLIEQQLLPSTRPSCRISGVPPYKPHHDRVQLERLRSPLLVRGQSRSSKELGHPSDGAASLYGRHRIPVVDFNFVSIHLLHSGA